MYPVMNTSSSLVRYIPATSYVTYLDTYVLFSYLVLFLVAGQNLVSHRIGDPFYANKFNLISGTTIGAIYLVWNLLALFIYLSR